MADRRTAPTCRYCQRTFRRIEHLTRHVRIHTKERPFKCQCGAAFARRDLLVRHERAFNHQGEPRMARTNDAMASSPAASLNQGTHQSQQSDAMSNDILDIEPQQSSTIPSFQTAPYQSLDLNPELLQHVVDFTTPESFREFGHFIDGLGGFPTTWNPYFIERDPVQHIQSPQVSQTDSILPNTSDAIDHGTVSDGRSVNDDRPGTPVGSWLPAGPRIARIVEDTRDNANGGSAPPTDRVTAENHAHLASAVESFRVVISPDFRLPSQHSLARYVTTGFEIFISNLPFVHHTWRASESSMEFFLAMCTVGAHYSFEQRTSRQLYKATKAIVIARLLRERGKFSQATIDLLWPHRYAPRDALVPDHVFEVSTSGLNWGPWDPNDTVPTLLFLSSYTSWQPEPYFVEESLRLQRLLAQVIRDQGLRDEPEPDAQAPGPKKLGGSAWREWIRNESNRRAKLSAFAFMNASNHAYNVYPVLRSSEIFLRLPCTTKEWSALTLSRWQMARKSVTEEQLYVQDALQMLLTNRSEPATLSPWPTPLGNYILLHALLQRIFLVRDLALPSLDCSSLPGEETETMERALQSWALGFKGAPESSLDEYQDHGPIPFTCTAMLALAYIRIHQNLGPHRVLQTRDPEQIAAALRQCPPITRSEKILSAVLHATHAISIPVRLGVERVARSQQFFWTIRHSLCAFECAVILSQWLSCMACTMKTAPLTNTELHIVEWVRRIVKEAYRCIDFDDEDFEFHDDPAFLSLAVLKVWAHFFKKNALSLFINVLGESLDKYRCTLQLAFGGNR